MNLEDCSCRGLPETVLAIGPVDPGLRFERPYFTLPEFSPANWRFPSHFSAYYLGVTKPEKSVL